MLRLLQVPQTSRTRARGVWPGGTATPEGWQVQPGPAWSTLRASHGRPPGMVWHMNHCCHGNQHTCWPNRRTITALHSHRYHHRCCHPCHRHRTQRCCCTQCSTVHTLRPCDVATPEGRQVQPGRAPSTHQAVLVQPSGGCYNSPISAIALYCYTCYLARLVLPGRPNTVCHPGMIMIYQKMATTSSTTTVATVAAASQTRRQTRLNLPILTCYSAAEPCPCCPVALSPEPQVLVPV